MNGDSTFVIGATHTVCQDYAVARDSYAIVSDGCSTSPDTDIGARLLVKAVEQLLHTNGHREIPSLHENAAALALTWANTIRLTPEAVDATLLTAHVSGDELLVMCSGDGVVVGGRDDGGLDVYVLSYPSGYPFYPAYLLQPERLDALRSTGPVREIKHFRSTTLAPIPQLESTATSESSTQVFTFKTSAYKYVALVSDGVHSFLSTQQTIAGKRVEPVPMPEVLAELLSFKSLHGVFVARRVKKFMKDCHAKGWQHSDDLSLAVIHPGGASCSPNLSSPA